MSNDQFIGRLWGMVTNEQFTIYSNFYEHVKTLKFLGTLLTNQNSIHDQIIYKLKGGNLCYDAVNIFLPSRLFSEKFNIKMYGTYNIFYGRETWF